MPRTAAKITQAEVARTLRAAKQVGAYTADVKLPGGTTVTVNLVPPLLKVELAPLAPDEEIVL